MGIYLIIACLICGGMACVSSFTTKRIQKLRDQMEKVKDNLPETLDCKTYKDEIGQLTDSYNYMVKTNRHLVKERNEVTREKNQMEMNVLRSQMNPHFLYNTLDMISWYAAAGSTNDVMDTIQVLASFYKISLNNGKVLTTLEQEIKLLELYMELQNRRSSETIELIVDVPELLLDQEILQFTLQPLVENSLKHGIFEKDVPEGMILITGRLENDEMVLNVEDDGVGMEPEVCQRLFQEKPKEKKKSGHIGVRNIYRRLLLYYGKGNFSMNYKSKIGEGTTVEIRVPCNLKAEEEQDDIGKE